MSNTKHEDAIMKMGFGYFRDTILEKLGIHYEFDSGTPTELIELTIHTWYMDFTFLTKDGFYVHIEFQTTNDHIIDDLLRFRVYEALLARKEKKKVITYVIFSGEIENAKTELDCGIYTYRVNPIYLTGHDADEIFRTVKVKLEAGERLSEEDFANLTLTPLMKSKMSRKDVIKKAIQTVKQEKQVTAELEEVKEALSMTRLGQMLYDDGWKKGREEEAQRISTLTSRLLKEHRLEDLQRSTEDDEFREKLMKEFGIE